MSDLLDQWLPQRSQQRVKKIVQLEGSGEILSNDQMLLQANKSQETVIKAPEKLNWNLRLRNLIEIQDPQNMQNSQ